MGGWQVLRAKGTVCAKTQRAGTHVCTCLCCKEKRDVLGWRGEAVERGGAAQAIALQ